MSAVLGGLALAAFVALVVCEVAIFLLATYLDLSRSMLVEMGQLPRSTPLIVGVEPSTMRKVVLGLVRINRDYVYSKALDTSADQATCWWAPILRQALNISRILLCTAVAFAVFWLASQLISASNPSR